MKTDDSIYMLCPLSLSIVEVIGDFPGTEFINELEKNLQDEYAMTATGWLHIEDKELLGFPLIECYAFCDEGETQYAEGDIYVIPDYWYLVPIHKANWKQLELF